MPRQKMPPGTSQTTLIRLPTTLLAQMRRLAAKDRRSLNQELVVALETFVASQNGALQDATPEQRPTSD